MTGQEMLEQAAYTDYINDICRQIADHYGFDDQSRILQEECAELIQAVSKVHRCKSDNERYTKMLSMAEEMADVIIMITQIRLLDSTINDTVNKLIDIKLRRQLGRIKEEDK